jgi:choline dehydrogenase
VQLTSFSLQDHLYFSIYLQVDASVSYSSLYHDYANLQQATQEFQSSKGPLTAPVGLSYGFEKIASDILDQIGASSLSQDRADQAHIEYLHESIYYPNYPTPEYSSKEFNTSYISLTAAIIAPSSRGSVSVKSNNIADPPVIDLQFLTAAEDQALAIYAFKNLRKVIAQFATYNLTIGFNNGEVAPGPGVQSDEDILSYVRANAVQVWHASGTCAMLPRNSGGVVDERLRVYDVANLRVVDTSVFPVIPDTHTQGPTYMLAEKAVTLIKQDHGL